jgi:hypothetical protein
LQSVGPSCGSVDFILDDDAIEDPFSCAFSEHQALSESIQSCPPHFRNVVLSMPILKALSRPDIGVTVDALLSASLQSLTISGIQSSKDLSFITSTTPDTVKCCLKAFTLKTCNARYFHLPTTFLQAFTALEKFEYSHRARDWPTTLPSLNIPNGSQLRAVSLSPGFLEVCLQGAAKLETVRVDPCTGAPPSYSSGYCDVVSQQLSFLGAFKASAIRPISLELRLPHGFADHIVDFTHGHHGRLYAARHRGQSPCICLVPQPPWKPQRLPFVKELNVHCPAFRAPPKHFYVSGSTFHRRQFQDG